MRVNFQNVVRHLVSLMKLEPVIDPKSIDIDHVAQDIIVRICNDMTTKEIDALLATTLANLQVSIPLYNDLASRVVVSSLHKDVQTTTPTEAWDKVNTILSQDFK